MADGVVGIRQHEAPDRLVDNSVVTNDVGQTVYRQKVHVTNFPSTTTLAASGEYIGYTSPATTRVVSVRKMFSTSATFQNLGIGTQAYHLYLSVASTATVTPMVRSILVSATASTSVRAFMHQGIVAGTAAITPINRYNHASGNPASQVSVQAVSNDLTTHTGAFASVVAGNRAVDLLGDPPIPVEIPPPVAGSRNFLVWAQAVPSNATLEITLVWSEGS